MKIRGFLKVLIYLVVIILMATSSVQSSQGIYVGTKRMGGAGVEKSFNITTDPSGNIYVTGIFEGTVNFGADFGTTDNKTATGNEDIFITKINANGTYGWTRRIGGASIDWGIGITTDPSGNVYITGYFRGTVDFGTDFGVTDSKTAAGIDDIFITRINANGGYGWTRRMGGDSDDKGLSIITDPSGNIYVTGYFAGTVDFGADFGTTDTKVPSGNYDIFVTRINANGGYAWTRRMGGDSVNVDEGYGITTDPSGNVYVTGSFKGSGDFGADFGAADIKTAVGDHDIFITRINADGSYGWTRRMGGISTDYALSIITDPAGNIYATGVFDGVVDFGADFSTSDIKTATGDSDIFITRISPDAGYGWTRRIGGTLGEQSHSITTDPSGNIYITGYFSDTVDFGTDFGTTDINTVMGGVDIFITRINADGGYGWTRKMGGASGIVDMGNSITTDSTGNVYITGIFGGTVNFGADFGVPDTKTSAGKTDIFITKLSVYFPIFAGHDFNGSGSSDVSVWRPSNGRWYIRGIGSYTWGQSNDIPANGDYNGDGATDVAVWRPSNGRWYIQGAAGSVWGQAGDIPIPGNYNGDIAGTTGIAVWRPTNGRWYIKGATGAVWGIAGDIPVPGDYNGDGKTDMAVWRPSNGRWYIKNVAGAVWGQAGDIPVPGDYNGDGSTDLAVWRPKNGRWHIKNMAGAVWGQAGDIPVPGDYNGDGKTDMAVWRPTNGRWYIKGMAGYIWGMLGDIPLVQ